MDISWRKKWMALRMGCGYEMKLCITKCKVLHASNNNSFLFLSLIKQKNMSVVAHLRQGNFRYSE